MNPKLFSDEFKSFKYLRSTPAQIEYYKTAAGAANRIRPWAENHGPDFTWPNRIEFVEQLLDLRHDSIYIVFAGIMSKNNEWEDSNFIKIDNPLIVDRNPIIYPDARDATIEDIPHMEENAAQYCLISANSFIRANNGSRIFDARGDNKVFRMNSFPLIIDSKSDFTELFADEDTARKYKKALTEFLRNTSDAVSAFGRAF